MNRLIGRTSEIDALLRSLEQTVDGRGQVALILGEPGIGKTALTRELADAARERSALVLWGRCPEGDWARPYAAWIEVMAPLTAKQPGQDNRHLPEFPSASGTGSAADLPPDDARLQLHDAVIRLIQDWAIQRPVVLVFDDLQWADAPSLDLVRHVAFASIQHRVLLVLTCRDSAAIPPHPVAELIANLRRESTMVEIELQGLSRSEIVQLLEQMGAAKPTRTQADLLYQETDGNPLFVLELGRHLLAPRDDAREKTETAVSQPHAQAVPLAVRQAIAQRFNRLSTAAQRALSTAAIFPDGFEPSELLDLVEVPTREAIAALDESRTAGFIQPSEAVADRLEFVHSIVRSAILANQNGALLVREQRRVAEYLASRAGSLANERSGEIATLYEASASLPGKEAGIPYALSAAETATRGADHPRAAHFLKIAQDLSDPGDDPSGFTDILCKLAIAQAESLADEPAEATGWAAIEALRQGGASGDLIAEFAAAIALALKHRAGADAKVWRPFVLHGLGHAGEQKGIAWARLNFLLEPVEPVSRERVRAGRWIGFDPEAISIARSIGTEEDKARSFESFETRSRAETDELIGLARGWRNPAATMHALTVAANDCQYRHAAFREAAALWTEVDSLGEKYGAVAWQAQAANQMVLLQIALGCFDEAAGFEATANDLLFRLGPGRRPELYSAEMATARAIFLGGDWSALAPFWTALADDPSLIAGDVSSLMGPFFAALGAYCWGEAGNKDKSRSVLKTLTPVLEKLPAASPNQNGAVAFAAAAVWEMRDTSLAPAFRRLAANLLSTGCHDYPQTSLHLSAARMSAMLERDGEARDEFEHARETLDASGQKPLRAMVDFDEARWCQERKSPDLSAAERLAQLARDQFESLQMDYWTSRASGLLSMIHERAGPPTYPAGLTDREVDVLRLVVLGQSDKEISDSLFISPRTVNAHMRNMFGKTGAANRTDLSVWALAQGLVTRPTSDSVTR